MVYTTYTLTFSLLFSFFFFNDTATTEIYTLSLHDALPISRLPARRAVRHVDRLLRAAHEPGRRAGGRSEEHTSELQSQSNLVCRLLLEKKKQKTLHTTVTDITTQTQHLHYQPPSYYT